MRKHLIILLCAISSAGFAHPGIGIVKDKKGNIFYTDLFRVWKISPDGKRTVVVSNVRTHELYMDSPDNYSANSLDAYRWCVYNSGKKIRAVETALKPLINNL